MKLIRIIIIFLLLCSCGTNKKNRLRKVKAPDFDGLVRIGCNQGSRGEMRCYLTNWFKEESIMNGAAAIISLNGPEKDSISYTNTYGPGDLSNFLGQKVEIELKSTVNENAAVRHQMYLPLYFERKEPDSEGVQIKINRGGVISWNKDSNNASPIKIELIYVDPSIRRKKKKRISKEIITADYGEYQLKEEDLREVPKESLLFIGFNRMNKDTIKFNKEWYPIEILHGVSIVAKLLD